MKTVIAEQATRSWRLFRQSVTAHAEQADVRDPICRLGLRTERFPFECCEVSMHDLMREAWSERI